MKKIGICTLYYKNRNYGANLQAYALQSVLARMGNDVQLIPFYSGTKLRRFLAGVKYHLKKKDRVHGNICIRNASIDRFRNAIPHSKCFYSNTIGNANAEFDCFITGSDQVWNPDWINPYMALQFVKEGKLTASYAASVGKISLNAEQQRKLMIALDHTQFISIREKESIPALKELTDKPISHVLDPTVLLTRDEWNEICTERIIPEEYMFCYFLGGNENLRKVATEYAKSKDLKLVTLPYLNSQYRKVDDGFADVGLYEVSPRDFLSLIRYAGFVMTDSFHAAVFSHMYGREFVVSGGGKDEMGCRMLSLTELFGTEKRYIPEHDDVSIEKLIELEQEPLKLKLEDYENMRQKSLSFLRRIVCDD